MSMTRTLGTRDSAKKTAQVQLESTGFFNRIYLPRSEFILVLSLTNDDLRHTASFWVGMSRWENEN